MFDTIRRRHITYWLNRVLLWLGTDRPWRMRMRHRSMDPDFEPTEYLYLRCKQCHVRNGRLADVSAIRFPDQSVNREKYGRPYDLLIPLPKAADGYVRSKEWLYEGVAAFPKGSVPTSLESDGELICTFRVEHDPLEYNYAHSEIRVYVGSQRLPERLKKKVSRPDRKRFRLAIFKHTRVIVAPLR